MGTRTLFLLALTILLAGSAAGGDRERVRVAVADLYVVETIEALEPELGESLAAVASDLLADRWPVLGRTDFLAALREGDVCPDELHDSAGDRSRAMLAAGVDILVTGRVSTFGDLILLHLRVTDRGDRGLRRAVMVGTEEIEKLPKAVGGYRDRFLDYLRRELRGRSGPHEFAKVFWGEDERDREVLEREFRQHVDALVERARGK